MADLQLLGPEANCIPTELAVSPDPYFFTRGVASQTSPQALLSKVKITDQSLDALGQYTKSDHVSVMCLGGGNLSVWEVVRLLKGFTRKKMVPRQFWYH